MDGRTFVQQVEEANRASDEGMAVEKSFTSIKTEGPKKVRKMVHIRLKQGLYNEVRLAEASAARIPEAARRVRSALSHHRAGDDERLDLGRRPDRLGQHGLLGT